MIVEITVPVGKRISFDESVMHAYNPWVVRRTWKEGNYWGHRWQSDWDYDEYFDLKPDINYTMQEDGKLLSVEEKVKADSDYRYNKKDNLRKSIKEREKKLDEERKQIEEDKKKLNDSIPSNDANAKVIANIRESQASIKLNAYSPISYTSLFN